MQVKLLQDILQAGQIKTTVRRGRTPVAWYAGAVVDVSPASAQKFIDAGQAEPVTAEESAE